MDRAWEHGPNAERILDEVQKIETLRPWERKLLTVGIRLDVGDRPLIDQHGHATFERSVPADHRVIETQTHKGGENHDESDDAGTAERQVEGASRRPAGSSTRRASAQAEEAASGSALRRSEGGDTSYINVGEVADEDRWELGVYFPQFSPALIYDEELRLWYREGKIRPLSWISSTFAVRLYYHKNPPTAPPVVWIAPEPPDGTPHLFRFVRNGRKMKALCYMFAPDGTWIRGRSTGDTAAEILRQVVMWLLRYMVWQRFDFFPGAAVSHAPRRVLEETDPDTPCPFHPFRQYRNCCRPRHLAHVRRTDEEDQTQAALDDGITGGRRIH